MVSNSVMICVDQSLMNTFALVYTLRTPDMWVPHFSPKEAALTSFFFIYFFVLDHFDQTVRRTVNIF